MAVTDDIQAILDRMNTPQQIQGRGGSSWGYDTAKRVWYTTDAKGKVRYENTDMGIPASVDNSVNGMIMPTEKGGGLLHGRPEWNQDQGKYVTPFSWDKLADYAIGGLLTAGVGNAVMAGAAPAAASAGGSAAAALPSSAITTGLTTGASVMAPTTGAAALAGAPVAGAGGGMGLLSTIGDLAKKYADPIGAMLTKGSQAAASNRGTQLDATLEQQRLRDQELKNFYDEAIARSAENRTAQGDSWKKLQQASYVSNWQQPGAQFSPYTRPLTGPSDDVKQGATALVNQNRDALTSGKYVTTMPDMPTSPTQFTLDPSMTNPSLWEQLSGYAGAGLGALNTLTAKKKAPAPGTM